MSAGKVLRLDDYRERGRHRLTLAGALYGVDRSRRKIFSHLAEVAELSGADRVAAVWVDEYGSGLIHPYVVLDLLSDRPRRSFQIEPLRQAWEIGVPGAHDDGLEAGSAGPSTFAIALGSDGTRAWFLIAESISRRPSLDQETRDRLMFLAGECSAVALHRDLDVEQDGEAGTSAEARFAGWPILKDIEGREEDDAECRRIAQRFVVARLVGMLLDDDLTVPSERIAEQVPRARAELAHDHGLDPHESRLWLRALETYEGGEIDPLARTLIELGGLAEDRGHEHGAGELYSCAHGLGVAVGSPHPAADAARALGRLFRRRALRDDAHEWYRVAQTIASAARLDHLAALALSGLASIKREMGNLPAAREGLKEALRVAEKSGHNQTIVALHREMVSLEHSAGNLLAALEHAWFAVGSSEGDKERTKCLASLAGALETFKDYDTAADAWTVVAETSDELYLRVFAYDALSHMCALRGDASGFEVYAGRCDALGYDGLHSAKVQILYFRGLSYRALGSLGHAETWLSRALAFAEEHGFNEMLFRAEEDLRTLPHYVAEQMAPMPAAPPAVREGLRAMRRELVGSGP